MRLRWFGIGILVAGVAIWLSGGLELGDPVPGAATDASAAEPSAQAAPMAGPASSAPRAAAQAATAWRARASLDEQAEAARQAAARDARGDCGEGRPSTPSWAGATMDAAAAVLAGRAVDRRRGASAGAETPSEVDMPALREAQRARLEGLAQGGPLPQAAALLLKASLDAQELSERTGGAEQAPQATAAPPTAAAEPLADRLAHGWRVSSSLPLLRLALSECQRTRDAGCSVALVRDWTLIEPDNAAAWLWQATLAGERGETQALDDAMYRASQASRIDGHVLELLQVLSHPAFDAAGGAAAAALQIQWIGIVMAQVWPEFSRVSRYCDTASLRDANRALRCEPLAQLLVEREGSLLGLSVGRSVAQRLRWPAERLALIDQRRLALQEQGMNSAGQVDPLACNGQQQIRQQMLGVARLGEIGHHRQRLAAAGLTEAAVAETVRRRLTELQAAAAASAALESASPASPAAPPASAPR